MHSSTEIRKLPPSALRELVIILEYNESWKKLMDRIPKTLEKDKYECPLHINNLRKYRTEHFKLIENASKTTGRSCTEILFDEWGTSGRVRPALGHLLYLLTSVELFRAADYVAVNLLHREPPTRPADGPPALVTIPDIPDLELKEVERILDSLDYPSSVISNLMNNNYDVNLNKRSTENVHIIPKIVVTKIQDNTLPLIVDNSAESRRKRWTRVASIDAPAESVSDMIKFSSTVTTINNVGASDSNNVMPNISDLITNSNSDDRSFVFYTDTNSTELPALSLLNEEVVEPECEENVPAISDLLQENLPSLSDLLNNVALESPIEELTPNLSVFNMENLPQISVLNPSESVVPQFSALLSAPSVNTYDQNSNSLIPIIITNDSPRSSNFSSNSNSSQVSRQTCASPLPNLSLNTLLPHFTFDEIEAATNSFDASVYTTGDVDNLDGCGRFLGSGAFGSVFLALNLVKKPVAVKKLFLNNVDVVNVDDAVTKQFKNEVEVLSKYKHENLLSLIGYSCDGPTYCLLYEFMAGGALKDRLQSSQSEDKLIWTDRMYIALGTARAVSYLHTAYSTPLIHRDIKTANILLDCNNKPKIGDFGLVKLLTSQNTNTSTSAFGTSAYMAREAFRGDVSVKLDTFSFGVVLLELITGLPPLDENRDGLDIVTHVEEICDDESGISPLIDTRAGSWIAKDKNFAEELYKICRKCLEENKKKRPTMVEISEQLTELIKESA